MGGYISADGVFRIRGPLGFKVLAGRKVGVFWLYRNGSRYTPTGHYADAVMFPTALQAKQFAESLV